MNEVRQKQVPLETREAAVARPTIDEQDRTFEVVWTTGARVLRNRPGEGAVDEDLVVEPSAVRIDRLNAGAPFLESHNAYSLDGVLGVVVEGSARISNGQGSAKIRLSERDDVEPLWQDIKAGIIRHVSVGYRVHQFERTSPADRQDGGERPLYRAIDWEPMEISAVAIGADPAAGIRGEETGPTPDILEKRTSLMETEKTAPEIPAQIRAAIDNDNIATSQMIAARAPLLRVLGKLATMEKLSDEQLRRATAAALAGDDFDAADARMRAAVLDAVAERDPTGGRVHETPPRAMINADWGSPSAVRHKLADARAAVAAEQLGLRHEPTMGRELAEMDGVQQARWAADMLGARGLRTDRQVLDWFTTRSGGAHGTSDFPLIAASSVEIVISRSIEQAPPALLQCVTRLPASDWRARNHVDFSSASPLRDTLEAEELAYGTIDEVGEPLDPPKRKALGVRLTHEALRNAAGQGVAIEVRIARSMIEAANEALRSTIGAAILSPPVMSDGASVFDVTRGNLESALAIDVDGLTSAKTYMSRFRDSMGTPRPVPLDKLLVAPEQHTAAEKLVAEIAPATVAAANPFQRRIEVLSDPELPDGSWYTLPNPLAHDGLGLITLDDMPTPRIESREAWNTFATEWRLQWPMAASWLKPTWFRGTVPE